MNQDINNTIGSYNFSSRAVAIIKYNNYILFQKRIKDKFWALPGGKIKIYESSEEALIRELNEELGLSTFKSIDLISVDEYFFEIDNIKYHQYLFTYNVELKDYALFTINQFNSVESNELVFKFFNINEINWNIVKPQFLKQLLNCKKRVKTHNIHKEG
jgi:ADP-ribose pyrophosphatase YjhB (NUDIX family)